MNAGRLADQAYHFGDASVPTEDIKSLRKESFESALSLAVRDLSITEQGVEIFQIAAESFECYVRSRFVVATMTKSISMWAEYVAKRREKYDENTHAKFDESIGLLHSYLSEMKAKQWLDEEAIASVEEALSVLSISRDAFAEKDVKAG
jgi:hypothetical protein